MPDFLELNRRRGQRLCLFLRPVSLQPLVIACRKKNSPRDLYAVQSGHDFCVVAVRCQCSPTAVAKLSKGLDTLAPERLSSGGPWQVPSPRQGTLLTIHMTIQGHHADSRFTLHETSRQDNSDYNLPHGYRPWTATTFVHFSTSVLCPFLTLLCQDSSQPGPAANKMESKHGRYVLYIGFFAALGSMCRQSCNRGVLR